MQKDLSGWLLASDIDGTIIDTVADYIPPRNITAIEHFMALGGRFTLATGRTHLVIKPFLSRVPINCPLVMGNGCILYDARLDRVVHCDYLTAEAQQLAVNTVISSGTLGLAVYNESRYMVTHRSESTEFLHRCEAGPRELVSTEQALSERWCKALIAGQPEEIDLLCEQMESFDLSAIGATGIRSDKRFYELLPLGVSKGTGLKRLADTVGATAGHICAIGDYLNDIDLLAAADISAAMAGAPDRLKQLATYTVCDVRSGGVAEFIEQIIRLA